MTKTRPRGAVAAGHRITALAAAQILKQGGNAFDAAIAALFASCVCEPVLASLGGGGFLMAHQENNSKTRLFDFFVQTPHKKLNRQDLDFKPIHVDFGTTQQMFHIGMGACAMPGFVSGCYDIHASCCRLPMATLLQPAIDAARQGVVMDGFQSRLFRIVSPILLNTDKTRALFAPQGKLLDRGDVFFNPQLAETLETLARNGPDFFYHGDIRDQIVDLSRTLGGQLTARDFSSYQTVERQPLVQPFGSGGQLYLNPPPSAGGSLIGFGLALARRLGHDPAGSEPDGLAISAILQETDHTKIEIHEHPDLILCDNSIKRALERLKTPMITSKGTTHISVIDAAGNAASATVSNGEGNGQMAGEYGFMLNNMLGEEDLNPDGFHQWLCAERLSSMMAPALVKDNQGALSVLGSGGANRIRSAMLQVLLHLQAGRHAIEAVDAARMHYEAGKLDIEDWIDQEVLKTLLSMYPETCLWDKPNMFFGGVHMVQRTKDGSFDGAGDARRDGCFMIVD